MQYEDTPKLTKEDFIIQVKNASQEELCLLLLGIYELNDWKWIQSTYLDYLKHQDKWVASAAIIGLGHLARVHGEIEVKKVVSCLEKVAQCRPELEGKVEDAISDINMFSK
ncbi:hypothetical protein [Baaleninema simplex]|uniref:hypothetical protein n=1 Tax=Baaleninema simplex TaxID=2862350 RepID=UPI00036613BD|nr:hypothetical protein [Baaleninema simplex]